MHGNVITNFTGITGETLKYGTSYDTPLVYKSEYICLECENFFETVKWKHYEIILCLLQEYWVKQRELMTIIEWYRNYIEFIAALKNWLTIRHNKEK